MQVLAQIQALELKIEQTKFALAFHGNYYVKVNYMPQAVFETEVLLDELERSLVQLQELRHILLSMVLEHPSTAMSSLANIHLKSLA